VVVATTSPGRARNDRLTYSVQLRARVGVFNDKLSAVHCCRQWLWRTAGRVHQLTAGCARLSDVWLLQDTAACSRESENELRRIQSY